MRINAIKAAHKNEAPSVYEWKSRKAQTDFRSEVPSLLRQAPEKFEHFCLLPDVLLQHPSAVHDKSAFF